MLLKILFLWSNKHQVNVPLLCALNGSSNMLKTFSLWSFLQEASVIPGALTHQPHTDSRGMCLGLQMKLSTYLKVYISQSEFPTWKQLKSQLYSIAVCEIQNACMASKGKLWKTATALAGVFLEGRADPVLTAQPKIHWKMLYRNCQCTCLKSRF